MGNKYFKIYSQKFSINNRILFLPTSFAKIQDLENVKC
jgi:hypothetical protein